MAYHRRNRTGQRVARLFRQVRGLLDDVRAYDLDRIAEEDDIDVSESGLVEPSYTACLMTVAPGIPPGIILAPGQARGRRRFSIAHELGHHYIPKHSDRPPGWCGDDAMTARADSHSTLEWEANDFAAELLTPRSRFGQDAAGKDPVFREIASLADHACYDVSITAAALRFVEVTSRDCALVCARGNRIEWVARSDSFLYRIPWRGDVLPSASVAATSLDEGAAGEALQLDPYAWLENEQSRPVELFESTHVVASQGQVLSLIWVVPEGSWV